MRVEAATPRWLRALLMLAVVAVIGSAASAGVHVVDGRYKLSTVVKDSLFAGASGAVIGSDGALYVGRTGRIRRAPLAGGKADVFLASGAGKVGALASDGDSLVVLDVIGGRLLRVDPKKLAITAIADGLPAGNGPVGVGANAVEFGAPLFVAPGGDVYLARQAAASSS
jgi:hypothetical protein